MAHVEIGGVKGLSERGHANKGRAGSQHPMDFRHGEKRAVKVFQNGQ